MGRQTDRVAGERRASRQGRGRGTVQKSQNDPFQGGCRIHRGRGRSVQGRAFRAGRAGLIAFTFILLREDVISIKTPKTSPAGGKPWHTSSPKAPSTSRSPKKRRTAAPGKSIETWKRPV